MGYALSLTNHTVKSYFSVEIALAGILLYMGSRTAVNNLHKESAKPATLQTRPSVAGRNDIGRILLFVVILGGVISVLVPRIFIHSRDELGFLPQLSVGFLVLVLIIYLQFSSQRKLLSEVSAALIAANTYVDRLEQVSFIDPETQLFNRMYLDQLFNQQLKWLNRCGKSATLLLFEVLQDRRKPAANEMVLAAARLLRSNFRGSDCILRNSAVQFLVLLPDTTEDLAQYALDRLSDKIDGWNLENTTSEMVLRHELSVCPPGGDLWESLREIEHKMRNKPDLGMMTVIPLEPAKRPLAVASLERCGEGGVSQLLREARTVQH